MALATSLVGCQSNNLNQEQTIPKLAQALKYDAPAVAQSPMPSAVNISPTPSASPPVIGVTRLNARGTGFYQTSGQPDGTINEATVVIQGGQDANLRFRFVEGYDLAYTGKVEQMDASNVKIRLVSPDYANIVGIAQVNFAPDNAINTVVMTGTSNLVPFQIQFRRGAVAQLPSPTPTFLPAPIPSPVPSPVPLPAPPVNALW